MNIRTAPAGGQAARTDAAEWQLRCDLAAFYRLVHHFGLSDLVFNHITARVPGPAHRSLTSDL